MGQTPRLEIYQSGVTQGIVPATGLNGGITVQSTSPTLTSTSTDTIVVSSPSSAQLVLLPSVGVLAGKMLVVSAISATVANYVTVKASSADALIQEFYGTGYVRLVALQNTPTAAAHWLVLDSADAISLNITPTGLTDNSALPSLIKRTGRHVTVFIGIGGWLRTKNSTAEALYMGTHLPTFLIPSFSSAPYSTNLVNNGSWVMGVVRVDTDGLMSVWPVVYTATFTANSNNNGMGSGLPLAFSYVLS